MTTNKENNNNLISNLFRKNEVTTKKSEAGSSFSPKEDKTKPLEEKKKSIWSLFSNVNNTTLKEKEKEKEPVVVPKENKEPTIPLNPLIVSPKENNKKTGNVNEEKEKGKGGLFKNVKVNTSIQDEIKNITESMKRKHNILITNENGTDDDLLSTVLSAKKIKKSDEKLIKTGNAYSEFLNKASGGSQGIKLHEENPKEMVDTTLIKDVSSKLKQEYEMSQQNKALRYNLDEITKKKIVVPSVITKSSGSVQKTVIKKKNICVPINEVNEKQLIAKERKIHGFSKHDKFDIFTNLSDDLFRYILSNVKNPKHLLVLNKRFSEMLRMLRSKLIYDEQLKNTIPPESILKTIYSSPNIEVLDLSGCSHITSQQFTLLGNSNNIKFNRTLKVLCLRNCNKISDSGVRFLLQRFKNLHTVDLRNCYKISPEGLFPLQYKTRLAKLYLGNMVTSNITNNHSNDSLKVLFGNTGENVQLEPTLKNLVCIEFTYTKQLTDLSHLYLVSKNMKVLNLKGCGIDDSAHKFFKNFSNLLALSVADTKISNEFLNATMEHCPKLKILDISKTFEVKNQTLVEIPKRLKELRKIKLSHLSEVDNFCIREIFKYSKNLLSVDFSGCWKVNNSFCNVNGLEIATGNRLKDIGAFQCSVDKHVCERYLSEVGCTNVRIHIYNELKIIEGSIYNDVEIVEMI